MGVMYLSEKEFKNLCKKMNIKPSDLEKKRTKKIPKTKDNEFDSLAEQNFFYHYIQKYIQNGFITNCEIHNEFCIIDAIPEYKLRKKVFKPDFLITTQNGETFVIEMKGKVVKKLQRDYGLRKHIFIEKYCIPNNWKFIELKSEEWTKDPFTASQQDIINVSNNG